jgi:hypothetical protein
MEILCCYRFEFSQYRNLTEKNIIFRRFVF